MSKKKEEIENQNTNGLYIIPEFIKNCNSIEEFEEYYKNKYSIKEIISTNARDIEISTDHGYIVLFGKKYIFTEYAANELCKLLKIPFSFTKKISLQLLNINVEELKIRFLQEDKEIEFIILDCDKDDTQYKEDKVEGIIANVVRKTFYVEHYVDDIIKIVKESDKVTFLKACISFSGYQIYCVNNKSKTLKTKNYSYDFGQCFIGDYYKINKHLKLEVFAVNNENQNTIYLAGRGAQSVLYLIKNNKGFEKDYEIFLRDNMKEDFGYYKESEVFKNLIEFAEDHNISYGSFITVMKKMKPLFGKNIEYVNHLFGLTEKEQVLQIDQFIMETENNTPRFDVLKKLLTTGIPNMNISNTVNNVLHSLDEMISMEDIDGLNSICVYLLDENFQCKTK